MKKENRLKRNHEIASVVNKRIKVFNKSYIIYYQPNDLGKVRVAISVSKKYGHAFERNKAKRIVRNIVRPYLDKINNFDIVIVIKNYSKECDYQELNDNLIKLIKHMIYKNKE